MKILFFIDCLTSGGKERRLVELMKGLNRVPGIQFELAIMSKDIHYNEVFDLGIPIHYILRRTKKDLKVFNSFYIICKQYKPDFVHCWDGMTALISTPVCKILQIKLVNGMITDTPLRHNIFYKPWLRARLTFPFSDIIIGNSKAGLVAYSAPKEKSIVINNGFNFQRIEVLTDKQSILEKIEVHEKYIVGMVAAFDEFKDYTTYFAAAELLLKKRSDVCFLAIGSNTDSEIARRLVKDENKDNFRFLGKLSGIESFINVMDICVLSTLSEGISNSIMEYMALGKPVIVTSGVGSDEIIENNKTGFITSPANPAELCEKIEILLNNQDLREKMGQAGKERVLNHFSIDKMVASYVDTYNKYLSK